MKNLYRTFAIFVVAAFFLLFLYAILFLHLSMLRQNMTLKQDVNRAVRAVDDTAGTVSERLDALELQKQELQKQELQKRIDRLTEFFENIIIGEFEVTAYAPLAPDAVEGMDYQGDPNVTASGQPPVPNVTAAAGPSVPFGSRVWIEGLGWRVVNDRGGRITDNHLDVVVATRAEAFIWGRQNANAVIIPPIPPGAMLP